MEAPGHEIERSVTDDGRSRQERRAIGRGAADLGVHLSPPQVERLQAYLAQLDVWNSILRLVGTRDRSRLITHHVVDSLAAAPLLLSRSRLVDIGSGAGLPGIPLAIARPDTSVTLVESRSRPVSFLVDVVRQLDLRNVRVIEERIEVLASGEAGDHERFDAAITRAWDRLDAFLGISSPLLQHGGIAIAMKGPRAEDELEHLGDAADAFGAVRKIPYRIEGAKARVLLVFERL